MEQLPPEFRVVPAAGELPPRGEVRVQVEFAALERRDLAESLRLEILDSAELQGVAAALPVALKGACAGALLGRTNCSGWAQARRFRPSTCQSASAEP